MYILTSFTLAALEAKAEDIRSDIAHEVMMEVGTDMVDTLAVTSWTKEMKLSDGSLWFEFKIGDDIQWLNGESQTGMLVARNAEDV